MSNLTNENNKLPVNYTSSAQNNDEIDIDQLLGILIDGKWLITLITSMFLFFGVTKAYLDSPVYMADAMMQVNEQSQTMIDPLRDILDNKIPALAEIEIIKSRMILGEAVANLDLDVIAKPKYFSVIGEAIARRFQNKNQENVVSRPLFGQSSYAWGGEAIQIETLTIPEYMENKVFIIKAGEQGHYQLFYDDELILSGKVGHLAQKNMGGNQASISIFVSLLKSRPDTQFVILRQSRNTAISQLKKRLTVAEKGKDTGILELTLESQDPGLAIKILNEIANIYVQQNVEHKSAESQKTLAFLEKQLPALKSQLEAANNILNEYKNRKGSIDLNVETTNILNSVVQTKTQETLLQQQRDELRQRYTGAHPSVVAIDKQIARLQKQIHSHDALVKTLPKTQQIILELSGDVEVKTNLYTTLLNNAQTLRVAKEGTVGDVRIIDYAVLPLLQIKPDKVMIVAVAFVLGFFLGLMTVILRKFLHRGIEDPDLIEKKLNIPIYATVPHSKLQDKLTRNHHEKYPDAELIQENILALEEKEDMAIESLRSLRTTIHFALLEAQNNIVLITGPSPGVGKSFISTNLATIMADAGKKILLIDGDLRKGYVNKILGVKRENGLSEIITNNITVEDATHTISQVYFDFIATGALPPNPSELLLHQNFTTFLDIVSKKYDLVIIDSPPILAVTDATIIGRMCSAVFMVVKAGEHPLGELQQSVKRLANAGTNVKGIIFNDVPLPSSRYGYGKYIYQYNYSTKLN